MPPTVRRFARESRKEAVLRVFQAQGRMTARQVAMSLGWPVAITNSVLTALSAEGRLRKVGSSVICYNVRRCITKQVGVYAMASAPDVAAMPAWLVGPWGRREEAEGPGPGR